MCKKFSKLTALTLSLILAFSIDRKSTRLNSSHLGIYRMTSSA